ncbi:type II toxin-antitoxin system HicB family antitoxin [uncultured Brachyspira sp.]|uniref:type II toxin-antitoxin system HicB family antitoxin n=1 Tax=uncultured Brachyspira sp. TaxID=221953 RepID=UPI002621074A|nr:type II toxin-antitoxin system HicB family antitoxin [uncultured Brachyspira sp.]
MNKKFFAYIEYDKETDVYVGYIPSIAGAHTLEELYIKLKEVLDLCLEEMDSDEINTIPEFVKIEEIELV